MIFEGIDDETQKFISNAVKPFNLKSPGLSVVMNRWIFAKKDGAIVATRECWDKRWIGTAADIVKKIKAYYGVFDDIRSNT